jgi:soluble lytic murein transglycosylase
VAQQLHFNGDYPAARKAYADLLRSQAQGSEVNEARWRLGQAYLEDGEASEAAVALETARQEVPSEELPAQVDFWLGEAYAAIDAPSQAIDAYRRYLEDETILSGPVYLRIGRLQREQGELETAVQTLNQAVANAPDNLVRFAALEELAAVHEDLGAVPEALTQYDSILASSQFDRYRAEIQYRAGSLLESDGQIEAAIARYRQAVAETEGAPFALQAANALANLGQPLDDYTWARILLANRYYADGIATMYRYLEAAPEHPVLPHLLVAEAYFSQREYQAAVAEWQKVLDTHPDYGDRAGVLLRMAAAQGRLDNTETARSLYRQAAETSESRAAEAILASALLAERADDCETAAVEYGEIAQRFPTAQEAGEALYRRGLCQYRLGQTSDAVETWQQLVSQYPDNTYAHAGRFWAGKGALETGNGEAAAQLWSGLRAEAPDSYYTAQASLIAEEAGVTWETSNLPPGSPELDPAAATEAGATQAASPDESEGSPTPGSISDLQLEAEQWLATWAAPDVEDPATLRVLPEPVANDAQLQRAEAYLRLGLRGEALQELDELYERYREDPLALYPLALHLQSLGAYKHAILAGVRLGWLSPDGLFDAPLFVQRLAYPTYFADIVQAEASARDMDPYLIYALIRQESFFERGARSFAAAQGLTQVIPSTAEWIAEAIGWPNFQPEDIYKPYLNIKFGTYYLWAALEMFEDNVYPALVGYNAGPGNARYWLEELDSQDNDLYVEEISLAEPKLYVRRVLAHYANYLRLYDGDGA